MTKVVVETAENETVYALKKRKNQLPRKNYPHDKDIKDSGYVVPPELKAHKALRTGTSDPRLSGDFAPFDFRTSPATGPFAAKNRILSGRLVRARMSGMSYNTIAQNFGIHPNHARRLVETALREIYPQEDAESLRAMSNAQYDKIIESWYDPATQQLDERAAKILLSALAEKRKLNGVDEVQTKKTETVSTVKVDLGEAANEILERYGSSGNIIDAEIIKEDAPPPPDLEVEYNPALLELLQRNREDNNIQEEGSDPVLIDYDFLNENGLSIDPDIESE